MFISLLVSVFFYVLISLLERVGGPVPKEQVSVANLQNRDVDTMTGVEFERYCINLLVKTGKFNRAQMTDVTNDYGADIVAVDNDGVRWVFQCKRYSSNLNNRAIQEVIASMAHYKATKAAVITNSWFTDNAKLLGRENGVWLIDRAGFKKLEEQAKKESQTAPAAAKPCAANNISYTSPQEKKETAMWMLIMSGASVMVLLISMLSQM